LTKQIYTLKEARDIHGLSQRALSELSGISTNTIGDIEAGGVFKTHEGVALVLADKLALEVNEIYWPRGLSKVGRPPLTGKPLAPNVFLVMQLCGSCFIALPATGICDDCS